MTVLDNGRTARFEYQEIDHCCEKFALVDAWLDSRRLQRRSVIGHGEARLAQSRDIVTVVLEHLSANETAFLHPPGVDAECDDARESLTRDRPRLQVSRD